MVKSVNGTEDRMAGTSGERRRGGPPLHTGAGPAATVFPGIDCRWRSRIRFSFLRFQGWGLVNEFESKKTNLNESERICINSMSGSPDRCLHLTICCDPHGS